MANSGEVLRRNRKKRRRLTDEICFASQRSAGIMSFMLCHSEEAFQERPTA